MTNFLIILLLVAEAFSLKDLSFDEWQNANGIAFRNTDEKNFRKKIFLAKKAEIEAHNANPSNSYKKALNRFSHLEGHEFISSRCKTVLPDNLLETSLTENITTTSSTTSNSSSRRSAKAYVYPFGSYTSTNAPSSVDFKYLMEPVQDQKQCGSCWAFAAMGQIEGMLRIKNSAYNTVLGPQYLVDCDTNDSACNGGWPTTAMNWLKSTGGNAAPSMISYPYTAVKGTCKSTTKISLGISTVTQNYFAGNEGALKAYIANYGPAVVAIYATSNFMSYSKGVLYDTTCPSGTGNCNTVNHAVIVTGYGTDPVYGDYWQVKNSWGSFWGESGYIRMARNKNNNCNIACWTALSS